MTIEYRKKSFILEIQAILGLIVPTIFLILIMYFGYLWQEYNPWVMSISELGAKNSPFGSVVSLIFILTGLSFALFGVGLHNSIKSRNTLSTGIMIIIFGLSDFFISGLFPTDGKGLPLSFSGLIHSLGSFIGDVALILAPFLFLVDLPRNEEWKKMKTITILVGILGMVLFVIYFLFSWFFISLNEIPYGFIQRLIIGVYFVWFYFLAFNLMLLSIKRNRLINFKS
jgi:hypothetical protein